MSSLLIHEPLHCVVSGPEMSCITAQDVLPAHGVSVQASILAAFSPLSSIAAAAGQAVEHVLAATGIDPGETAGAGDGSDARFVVHASGPAAIRSWHAGPLGLLPLFLKGVMDVFLGALLLALTAPCFLAIMAVSSLDGGPIFFAHRRVGIGGRPFHCLKFRTMVVDSDRVLEEALAQDPLMAAEWTSSRKLNRDPRVTAIGRFLRKTSLDELPQLINVLRRDMSLVGPRPIVENEVHLYGENIAQYYAIRPGLTGLWQISGRSSISYGRRVELDTWYVNNRTIWRDLAVLLKTVPVVLRRQGAC